MKNDLNSKLDIIIKYLSTIDLNLKLVLDAFNKSNKSKVINNSSIISNMPNSPKIKSKTTSTKISVQQNLFYKTLPEGENVLNMAQVKFFINSSDKEVKTVISDMAGQWKAILPLNNYRVTVIKQGAGKKPAITHSFMLNLDESSPSPYKLEPLFLP